ncbi:MAG: DUF11 domain-containing protein [Candidatus Eisenbacteria bacterium]
MPEISYCTDLRTTLDTCGDVDFFPVFFEVIECQGIEYGVTWPGSYSCAFTSCSDLKIGDIIWPGDGVSHAWFDCQPGPVAIPGWGWVSVNDSGHIRVVPHPGTGEITVGDCVRRLDDIEDVYSAGVCGALGDDPSGWGYNPLNVGKRDGLGGECAAPDQSLIYTIQYDSPNSNLIHDATLVDYLPPEIEFVSTTDGGTYDIGTHAVTWDIGTISQYAADSAQVITHIPPATPYGTLLTNRCRITGLETGPTEVEMLTTVCTGGSQALTITKNDGLGSDGTVPGAGLTYTITYANSGNLESVHDAILTDLLPPEVEFVSADDPGVYDAGQHSITWDVGTLGSDASGTAQAQVVVSMSTDPGVRLINRCWIVCSEAPAAETAETTRVHSVESEPLAISKRAKGPSSSLGPFFPGDDITYTITYGNNTNDYAVHGVLLRDVLPAQTGFVSSSDWGMYDSESHSVTWDIGTLAPDEAGSRQVVVRVPLDTEPGTIISNLCRVFSDEAPSSKATAQTVISSFGECMIAIHVRPHQQTTTCTQIGSDVNDCGDIVTTTGSCDVDVFPVFFEIVECQGLGYGLTWPAEWGEMAFTSCSDVTEGTLAVPGDGVSHSWTSCRTNYVVIPGYGRLIADSPGLIELIHHPATGMISLTTCRGYEYQVYPMGGLVYRAGVCGAAGDPVECGGPQRIVPTTWSSIKALFR